MDEKEKHNEDARKILEYADIKEELSNKIDILMPAAFVFAGSLLFISFMFGRTDHSWFATMMGAVGIPMLIIKYKERKKLKERKKELEVELKLNE